MDYYSAIKMKPISRNHMDKSDRQYVTKRHQAQKSDFIFMKSTTGKTNLKLRLSEQWSPRG